MSADTEARRAAAGRSRHLGAQIWVVYDGMCPFCTRYVMLYRIRQLAEKVHMIDARSDHPVVRRGRRRAASASRTAWR